MRERINIVKNNIIINADKLKEIIVNEWLSGSLYKYYYDQGDRNENLYKIILNELSDYTDGLAYETTYEAQKKLNLTDVSLDWYDKYPKSDIRSIGFEVLRLLQSVWSAPIEELTTDDIPMILEFLDTPPGKSLEAWDKWEKYWASLDYPARRKKLLETDVQEIIKPQKS